MREQFFQLKNEAISLILATNERDDLENIRVAYLGKKGKLTQLMKEIPKLPLNVRPELGQLANESKITIEDALQTKALELSRDTDITEEEVFDPTLPGIKPSIGHLHPQTYVIDEIIEIFKQIGYQVADGPEVESDYYNFEALNIPKDHPARDTQQTLYVNDVLDHKSEPMILRTQTSNLQGRIMESGKPPLRVIVPGKVYRYEQVDASHGFEFMQLEGFAIDTNITMTDLFGTIDYFLKAFFGKDTKVRFVCHNFPFVEPGAEAYMTCTVCKGDGCTFCKRTGWVEILGAGMVHPFVLKTAGIDPKKYQGFAFGMGLSRLITMKYQIEDLRLLTSSDLRILEQF